ncbi:hypothetical protein RND61_03505 [Streptomyces sp. TRM76323]|uniref:WCX domain-containing protein n=1 Tax=Streptomyces tamarix TaxID=3078565 RepID=A0ABU3QER1_9ACTN|nr:hypothetical protein [Streptomyces tamarix]MDT9681146.1 hypothetical protein [Streptomyces tamarix]
MVRIGGNSADQLAAYLLGLAAPLTVLSPDEVRRALVRHAHAFLAAHR